MITDHPNESGGLLKFRYGGDGTKSKAVIPRSPSTRDLQTVVILSAAKDLLLVKSSTQMNADLRRFTQIKERERSF